MPSDWDDFDTSSKCNKRKRDVKPDKEDLEGIKETKTSSTCDWGFGRQYNQAPDEESTDLSTNPEFASDSSKFALTYEKYLEDKSAFTKQRTKNLHMYQNNPEKALHEWFNNEGNEFSLKADQLNGDKFVCRLDIPLDDQDFSLTSEVHNRKRDAVEQICLTACKLLDDCDLLYSWQSASNKQQHEDDAKDLAEKKRLLMEANKDDDIELDSTSLKRHGDSSSTSNSTSSVNTYESLMAKWNELNMLILQSKARLVKLDLSVALHQNQKQRQQPSSKQCNNDEDNDEEVVNDDSVNDDVDPLDEFMSTLTTKTKLSMDDKIEKSRIKSQIVLYEREQSEVSRLIEMAKPKFNFNKACPPTTKSSR